MARHLTSSRLPMIMHYEQTFPHQPSAIVLVLGERQIVDGYNRFRALNVRYHSHGWQFADLPWSSRS